MPVCIYLFLSFFPWVFFFLFTELWLRFEHGGGGGRDSNTWSGWHQWGCSKDCVVRTTSRSREAATSTTQELRQLQPATRAVSSGSLKKKQESQGCGQESSECSCKSAPSHSGWQMCDKYNSQHEKIKVAAVYIFCHSCGKTRHFGKCWRLSPSKGRATQLKKQGTLFSVSCIMSGGYNAPSRKTVTASQVIPHVEQPSLTVST